MEGANTTLSWNDTLDKEGRSPDAVFQIHLPDSAESIVAQAAASERAKPRWDWNPTNKRQTNCTVAAANVLQRVGIGTIPIGAIVGAPNDFLHALNMLSIWPQSGVTRLPSVPW